MRLDAYWRELHVEPSPRSGALMRDLGTLRTQYRVGDFVGWQRDGALELNPNFQRRPVWKKGAKSYLIDTILRGLPMPIIFLRDLRADLRTFRAKRDVVDGQQRIRTILSFIDPTLLPDFEPDGDDFKISRIHNKELGGKSFAQLSPADQQQILDYQFSVHSFPADTDDREILQIFARMNSTGVKLNAQELRNAEFFGLFKTKAYELATEQLYRWRDWRVFTPDQIARMNEVELTSEFMILIMSGILEKTNPNIDWFYDNYDSEFEDAAEVERRFRHTFEMIETQLSEGVLQELFNTRTMFFALFATMYGLMFGLRAPLPKIAGKVAKPRKLQREKPNAPPAGIEKQLIKAAEAIKDRSAAEPVLTAVRGATTDASARRVLIKHLAGRRYDPTPAREGQVPAKPPKD